MRLFFPLFFQGFRHSLVKTVCFKNFFRVVRGYFYFLRTGKSRQLFRDARFARYMTSDKHITHGKGLLFLNIPVLILSVFCGRKEESAPDSSSRRFVLTKKSAPSALSGFSLMLFFCFSLFSMPADAKKRNESFSFQDGMLYQIEEQAKRPTISSSLQQLGAQQNIDRGNTEEAFKMGLLYQEKNPEKAIEFFEPAVSAGNMKAANNQAVLLKNLTPPKPQNLIKSVSLLWRAAKEKEPYALYNLCLSYDQGKGLPRDKIYAYLLCGRAVKFLTENSLEQEAAAKKTRELEAQLTPLQKEYLSSFIPHDLAFLYEEKELLPQSKEEMRQFGFDAARQQERLTTKQMPLPHITGQEVPNKNVLDYFPYKKNWRIKEQMMPFANALSDEYDNTVIRRFSNQMEPLAPLADDIVTRQTLYYRKNTPARLKMTLNREFTVFPAFVGDEITLLTETTLRQTKQAPNVNAPSLKNTDWEPKYYKDTGVLFTNWFPMIEKDMFDDKKAWMALTFIARLPGWIEIQYQPRYPEEGTKPYTVRILVNEIKKKRR